VKVFLDDERQTPAGWTRVYWPEEAIELLKTGNVSEISLDHDLGDDEHGTGYDVILWIEEAVVTTGFRPPKITVHSANSSARAKMEQGIEQIYKYANSDKASFIAFPHKPKRPQQRHSIKRLTPQELTEGTSPELLEEMKQDLEWVQNGPAVGNEIPEYSHKQTK